MKHIFTTILAIFFVTFASCAQQIVKGSIENAPQHQVYIPTYSSDGADYKPLNIILMIGDGTGLAQIAAGYFANNEQLTYFQLKHMGLVTTKSASDFTTDSAASGTAYATGQKTTNYTLGVDTQKRPIPNIPELIAPEGFISGVVSTDNLHGATPAAFFAHQPNRDMVNEIWADLPSSALSYFAAGDKETYEERPEATRKAIEKEFTIVNKVGSKQAATAKRLGVLPTEKETGYIVRGRTDFLPNATREAIDFLNARKEPGKGFFLMVEGARIDKACHANKFDSSVLELLDFDQAIAQAIEFADQDGHTLVIISADHETSGLAIWDGDPSKGEVEGVHVSNGHTAIPVPLFAYGPHAQDFMGVQGNEQVSQKILKLLLQK